jgi:hypothetical protein
MRGTKGLIYFACGDQVPSFGETAVSDVCYTCSIFDDDVMV